MTTLTFSLEQSLRGVNTLKTNAWEPSGFTLGPMDWPRYITSETAYTFEVTGLKPNTFHKVFLGGQDVTAHCKQEGYALGAGIKTDDKLGFARFTFFYKPSIEIDSGFSESAAKAQLLSGEKTLNLVSYDDASSKASISITPPRYAVEEPTVIIKKTPQSDTPALKPSFIEAVKTVQSGPYFTPTNFTCIQSFYLDPESVRKATAINLTSVDLFVKRKPSSTNNFSGMTAPGVSIAICEVENDQPNLSKTLSKSVTYVPYEALFAFGDASTPTKFRFSTPLRVNTGKFYGIVVMAEDPNYEFWSNKTGDKLVGTNIPSSGINSNKDGKLYLKNNSSVFNTLSDTDLKFTVNCAKYTETTKTKTLVNRNYEFLTISKTNNPFIGGEWCYKVAPSEAGTCSVVQRTNIIRGSGTSFNNLKRGQQIVLKNGSNAQIVGVVDITNNTLMTVDTLLDFSNASCSYIANTVIAQVSKKDYINNQLHLVGSTANVVYLDANSTLIGVISGAQANIVSVDNFQFDRVRVRGDINTPVTGNIDVNMWAAESDDIAYVFNNSLSAAYKPSINDWAHFNLNRGKSYCLSRSKEVAVPALFSNTSLDIDRKSIQCDIDITVEGNTVAGIFQAPEIENAKLDVYAVRNVVSNACNITVGGIEYDSEILGNGVALSKHIANKIQFTNNRTAEDVRMFMTAYRPLGTQIRCYARLYNSKDNEAFDDKTWTPLEYISNSNKYSSLEDEDDFIEFELGLMSYSEAANTLPGTFVSAFNSTSISVANSTLCQANAFVSANDVIRIYNPLFPNDNYEVGVVSSSNTTHIILGTAISTNNVVGTGLKIDKVKYPEMAFNNINNDNVCRYYNSSRAEFDGYNTMQVKIVLLADNTYKVPRVDQIQVIGVSA